MTTYNIGDRVVYKNVQGGISFYDGTLGTVNGPGYRADEVRVKWDGEAQGRLAAYPFDCNISLAVPPAASDPVALLRAQADALDAEAREARKESNDLQKRVWKLDDKVANAIRLAAQYRNVATDLEARS